MHHIFPVSAYPEFRLEAWNLISVAGSVHDRLHDRTTGELTEEGRALLERTARLKGIEL